MKRSHEDNPSVVKDLSSPKALSRIQYNVGSALEFIDDTPTVVMHVCNDVGIWGRGFVTAVSALDKGPEVSYRNWHHTSKDVSEASQPSQPFELGEVQFVPIGGPHVIANMIAQHGVRWYNNQPPLRIDALRVTVCKVLDMAVEKKMRVQCPRIGCALGGGSWRRVEAMLTEELHTRKDLQIHVYTLNGARFNA